MINENILYGLLIFFIIFLSIKIYQKSKSYGLKCIISSVDGNEYCVRDRAKLHLVANKLATATNKLKKLVKHLVKKYPNDPSIKRLHNNFNPNEIYETLPTSSYTAYSENKGEKIAFCLDTEKNNLGKLIDNNTLMYVALHELSHVMSVSIGHNDEFWSNFKFLIIEAEKINIYKPVDYKKNNERFCGTNITDNPYFDY